MSIAKYTDITFKCCNSIATQGKRGSEARKGEQNAERRRMLALLYCSRSVITALFDYCRVLLQLVLCLFPELVYMM